MNKKVVSLFSFQELKEAAQKSVLDKFRHINVEDEEWEYDIFSKWKKLLSRLGYDNIKILYSGFGSQGDGACFIADVEVVKWLKKHKRQDLLDKIKDVTDEIRVTIKHTWRYYYASSTDVDYDYFGDDKYHAVCGEIVKLIEKEREVIGNKIYRELDNLYFSLISDESVIDSIQANDYEFLSNGCQLGNVM